MKYEVVVYGHSAVISESGNQVRGAPPDDAQFFSPEGTRLAGPPLPFKVGLGTPQQAEAWAREHGATEIRILT
jgi:hypothetical protein